MSRTRTVVLTALAAALLVAGIAYGAATNSAHPGTAAAEAATVDDSVFAAALGVETRAGAGEEGRRWPGGGMLRHGPMVGMGQWMLHGEAVVKDRDGNYVTVAVQGGSVSAVDGGSVTVKSDDGYTRSWSLTDVTRYWSFPGPATAADLAVGAQVRVAGAVVDGAARARLVWFPPEPGQATRPAPAPSLTGSSTGSGSSDRA